MKRGGRNWEDFVHESPPGVKRGGPRQRRRAFSPRMAAPVTGAVIVRGRKTQSRKVQGAK